MERLQEHYNKETMKMAMLKHEKIFKEQVYELHRLYRIQKLLMNDMERRKGLRRPPTSEQPHEHKYERWRSEHHTSLSLSNYNYKEKQGPQPVIDLEGPAEDNNIDDNREEVLQIEQEFNVELTLGRGYRQMKKDEETSLALDCGSSFSSSSTESSTLQKMKVGTWKRKNTREMLGDRDWGLIQMPDTNTSFQSEKENAFILEEQLRQERPNQKPWFLNVMSLNMT